MRELSDDFVHKSYINDPVTEDFLYDGTFLENGMVILIEDPRYRADLILAAKYEDDYILAQERNRWIKVSRLEKDYKNNYLHFQGDFMDGSSRKLRFPMRYAWFVKKDSMDHHFWDRMKAVTEGRIVLNIN